MKKPTWTLAGAVLVAVTLAPISRSLAEDSFRPCWRGNTATTYENWSFSSDANPAAPETFVNAKGTPLATITQGPGAAPYYTRLMGSNRSGGWDIGSLNGHISLSIPNYPGPWKRLQVQITYLSMPGLFEPPWVSIAGGTLLSSSGTVNEVIPGFGSWVTTNTFWLVQPGPANEVIVVNGTPAATAVTLIDQIIVDTLAGAGGDGDVAAFRPCWRGQPNSTFQQWLFGVSNSLASIPAEVVSNSFSAPLASAALGTYALGWFDVNSVYGCRNGIWGLGGGGAMTFNIPNKSPVSASSYKYVQVQVTQYRDLGIYDANGNVSIVGATLVSQQETEIGPGGGLPGGRWVVAQTVWRLGPPSPNNETVVFAAAPRGSLIDQVAIDTLCLDFPCPANVSVQADPGACSKTNVTWALPPIDGCVVTNITCTPPRGSTFPVGTSPVTVVALGADGNSSTCTFNVTVTETVPPSVSCPANLTAPKAADQCGAVVNFVANGSDNCGSATVTCVPASGSIFVVGTTIVTCTARDSSGNVSAPCSFAVNVLDFSGDYSAFRPCWRGKAGSTLQHWIFSNPTNPAPETFANPYATPQASVVLGNLALGWFDQNSIYGCVQGVWGLGSGGSLSLAIPNASGGSSGSKKYVRVQVAQYRDTIYSANAAVTIAGGTLISEQEQQIAPGGGLPNARWVVAQSLWVLGPPCPASETVVIAAAANGSLIDQVVVDTLCSDFPCPAAIGPLLADLGQCSKSNVTWTIPTLDPCLLRAVSYAPPPGSTFPVGTNWVNQTTVDPEGRTNTCAFAVVIADGQLPVARCRNISVPLDGTGNATITAAQVDDGSTDNCAVTDRTVTPNAFTCATAGSNRVTLTIKDAAGNVGTCTAVVMVLESVPPTITCPSNVVVTTAAGQCRATNVALGTPITADNCGVAGVVNNAPAAFNKGVTLVIWTVADASGNTNTCTQTVTVVDAEPPTITCPSNVVVQTAAGICQATNVALGTPVTADNCGVAGAANNAPAAFNKGVTTVTWTVTDTSGNTNTCTQTVTVVDNEPPTITCPSNVVVSAAAGLCQATNVALGTPVTTDSCAVASLTNNAPAVFNKGVTTVTWTLTDASGNTATCAQTVTVVDTEKPTITCPTNVVAVIAVGQCQATNVALGLPVTADNCGTVTVANNAPAAFNKGITTVIWTATDSSGNTNTCAQAVTVLDPQPPTIICPSNVVVSTAAGICQATNVALGTPTSADNCGLSGVTNDAPAVFNKGTTTVIWSVADLSGNVATCVQTVTVVDTEPPRITCRSNVVVNADPGTCLATGVALATPAIGDNCGLGALTNNAPVTFNKGVTTVTWTVTDSSGNSSSCVQTVTVLDAELPSITCPANLSVNTSPGLCQATNVALGTPVTADNCAVASVVNNAPAAFGVGVTTVTWTVTDTSGNSKTCVQTVTVADPEPPTISCPSDLVLTSSGPICQVTNVALGTPVARDNCTVVTVTNDAPALFPCGDTLVRWTARDAIGNSVTCVQKVTVVNGRKVAGQVQLQGFLGTGTAPLHARTMTFVATDAAGSAGTVLKTWQLTLTNASGDTFSFALDDLPPAATYLSVKTDWNLRRKLALTFDPNGQAVANFTGASKLLGGDIAGPPFTAGTWGPPDNVDNLADYSALVQFWMMTVSGTPGAARADINGDGSVNVLDYSIVGGNWFLGGDAP